MTAMTRVAPSGRANLASRTASLAESCWTLAAPRLPGSRIASGAPGITTSRSASVSPESSAWVLTMSAGPPPWLRVFFRNRAAASLVAGAAPARSTMIASAPLSSASASLCSSAGAMRSERMGRSGCQHLRLAPAHERRAAALGDQCPVLLERTMPEFDQPRLGARLGAAHGHYLGLDPDRVALKQGRRKRNIRHAEIGDGRADRGVVDGNADHQPEREQGIHDRPPPFGFGRAKMRVDMQRLRVQRHVGEQHVVHLGDGARQPVAEHLADRKALKVKAATRMAKSSGLHGCSDHNLKLILTMRVQSARLASTAMTGEDRKS